MQAQKVRVLLGSDGAQARDFLSALVEKQAGVIIGRANNALAAVALARNLRPDVVILDCHLPHNLSLGSIPLSRAGGLDAAQVISKEIPNSRVLLVNNLDTPPLTDEFSNPNSYISLFQDSRVAAGSPLFLHKLIGNETENLIFARAYVEKPAARGRWARVAEEAILFGTAGIIFGLMMALTGLLLIPGLFSALLGGTAALSGLLMKALLPRTAHAGDDK